MSDRDRTERLLANERKRDESPRLQALWVDDAGCLRIGRTGDLIQMMDDLAVRTRA